MKLKFSLEDFRELHLPDLLINIWNYSDCKNSNCFVCNQYRDLCVQAAYEKWSPDYKDFNAVINNLRIQNKSWFDVSKLCNDNKNDIYNVICKWFVKCKISGKWKPFMNEIIF